MVNAIAFDFEINPTITGTVVATVGDVSDMVNFTITLTDVLEAEASTSDTDFPYTFTTGMDEDGIPVMTITGYDEILGGTDVSIPAYIEDQDIIYTVTAIGDNAFTIAVPVGFTVAYVDKGLTSVVIPNIVISIGEYAFRKNSSLTVLDLGSGVKIIGDSAFRECGLMNLTIPDNVQMIDDEAFRSNSSLTTLNFGSGLSEIPNGAFAECGLESLTIPDHVKTIGIRAFFSNSNLTTLSIGAGLDIISFNTFRECNLSHVSIPDNISIIDAYAFAYNTQLKTVDLGMGVKFINQGAFFSCRLEKLTIPVSVETIITAAFSANPIRTLCADFMQRELLNQDNVNNFYSFDGYPTTKYTLYYLDTCPSDE